MFRVCLEWVKIEGQSPLTVAIRYGVSLAPLVGLRFLDEAELQQFVDLRADGGLLFSGMVSRGEAVARHLPLRSIDFDKHWVDLCRQGPADVENMPMYSLQRHLICS
jgi:hypothetical protein